MRALCPVDELIEGAARGFAPAPGSLFGLFALRQGETIRVFVNSCPHLGVSLDWRPDDFLDAEGRHIVCSTHGARFRLDGACVDGPCRGAHLELVPHQVQDGVLMVAQDAGM